MKYNVGDKVRIKSLDWYNENKDEYGNIDCGDYLMIFEKSQFCGKIVTISSISNVTNSYKIEEDNGRDNWTEEMIEGLVERNGKTYPYKIGDRVVLKGNNRCATITDLKYNSWGNLSYYIKIDNDKDISIDYPADLLLPYDHMVEGLVEEEEIEFTEEDKYWCDIMSESDPTTYVLPQGYIFKDENGNVINAMKIVLEKANTLKTQSNMETETHRGYYTTEPETTNKSKKVAWFTFWDNDFADKVELDLSNRELIQENGKWFVVKKKNEYPKTYEECLSVLGIYNGLPDVEIYNAKPSECTLFESLIRLKRCRDAYWKIAGEKMGLGKPWEPDYDSGVNKYGIICMNGVVQESNPTTNWERHLNKVLDFPTAEMRDAFKENFDPDIEFCKELL